MEARSTKMNFFDLSELDKLSDTKKKGGQLRRSIPSVLAKAKPKAGGADKGGAVTRERKANVQEHGVRDSGTAGEEVPSSSARCEEKVPIIHDKKTKEKGEVFIPSQHTELLESLSTPGRRSGRTDAEKQKKKVAKRKEEAGKGLEELHRAAHLSHYEGADDISKVIKAEPLEERKQRILAQNLVRKKRGRPKKSDAADNKKKRMTKDSSVSSQQDQEPDQELGDEDTQKSIVRQSSIATGRRNQKDALVKVEDEDQDDATQKKQTHDTLADKKLDAENWSLKDIVKWGNARERRLAKEHAKTKPAQPSPPPEPIQEKEPQHLHPKVTVKDGKVVVDKASLTVAAQQKEQYTKVVTEDTHRVNSMSYVNRLSNDRWSVEDTELFFRALSQFGTDFTLIAQLFPGRQRKHLKKKFCKEGKHNAARIDEAMKASAHATISSYRDMIRLLRESGMNVGSS